MDFRAFFIGRAGFKKPMRSLCGALVCTALLQVACTEAPNGEPDEEIIGVRLQNISSLNLVNGEEPQNLALFDETIRKVHWFDLAKMKHLRAFGVQFPESPHYVLQKDNGYVIDITQKGLAVYSIQGLVKMNPIRMQGKPLSAAFREDLGWLVLYDDTNSIGILKIDNNGEIEGSWIGGPILGDGYSVAAGDINAQGTLVLSLRSEKSTNGDRLALVDLEATIASSQWQYTSIDDLGFERIRWLAPIPGTSDQILVRSEGQIAALDLSSKSVISSLDTDGYQVEKYSKAYDPHVILRKLGSSSRDDYKALTDEIKIVRFDNNEVAGLSLTKRPRYIVSSHLDLKRNQWTYIDRKDAPYDPFADKNEQKQTRTLVRHEFKSLGTQQSIPISDGVQVELSPKFLFSLHASDLGYATRINIETEEMAVDKAFNLGEF